LTVVLIAVGTGRAAIFGAGGELVAGIAGFAGGRGGSGEEPAGRIKMKLPVAGEIWLKYQVAQLSRISARC